MRAHVFLLSAYAALATAICWHPDDAAPTVKFGYSLELGPLTWAGLPPARDWNVCRLGKIQSPIVIHPRWASRVPMDKFNLRLTNAAAGRMKLMNLETTLEVPAERIRNGNNALGGLLIYEQGYILEQIHFHTPSEHRIDDEYYPLEMHMVFSTARRELLVIGVLFQLGTGTLPPTHWLRNVFVNLKQVVRPGTSAPTGALNVRPIQQAIMAGPLYTYNGSLTTPPCTEGVRWVVLGKALPIDVVTYNAVKSVMKFNSRYSQNGPTKINLLEKARRIADGLEFQDLGINVQDEHREAEFDIDTSD